MYILKTLLKKNTKSLISLRLCKGNKFNLLKHYSQSLKKCIENSRQNIHLDIIGCERLSRRQGGQTVIFSCVLRQDNLLSQGFSQPRSLNLLVNSQWNLFFFVHWGRGWVELASHPGRGGGANDTRKSFMHQQQGGWRGGRAYNTPSCFMQQ